MEAPMTRRELLKLKVEIMTDAEVAEVLEYIAIMESLSAQPSKPDKVILRLFFEIMKDAPLGPRSFHRQRSAMKN